ncbi:MAG: hypothetical protein QOI87_784, partial [Bradyrhizobium sp.]|nr:hypothetical protein [Bradyrhizobium sp.]
MARPISRHRIDCCNGALRVTFADAAIRGVKFERRLTIYRRLQAALDDRRAPFEELWKRIAVPFVGAQDSFEYLVDHSLMRPRFLINIVENAIAHAINRGHTLVTEEDCRDAVRQHANILVDDFGYEIRDVSGISADVLYSLIGATKSLTRKDVLQRF